MSLQLELLQTRNFTEAIVTVLLSVLFAVLSILVFIAIMTIGGFEIDLGELWRYAFVEIISDGSALLQVLYWATPLMLTGLAVALAFQVGLFNIGGQGQLMMGAAFSAIWAAAIVPNNLPFLDNDTFFARIIMVITTLLMGFIFGGVWGYIPGWLKAKTGAHEVITTIMMNLIAISLITFLVGSQTYSPFVDKSSTDAYSQTDLITDNSRFAAIFPNVNNNFNVSTIYTILILIIFQVLIFYTNYGFKLRAVGFNKTAAETAGIKSDRLIITAMTLSGGVAGMAGAFIVMGPTQFRYVDGLQGTLGFDGIAVALIAQNTPIAIILAAVFFGFLKQGKNTLDRQTTIPPDLIFALQALVIIFVAAPLIARYVYNFFRDTTESVISRTNDNNSKEEAAK